MMLKKISIIAATLTLLFAPPVAAHQSPADCNGNRLNLSVSKNKTTVREGDTLTYTITVANVDEPPVLACDIDGALVTITLPAADGTPTGTLITLESSASYPAGTTPTTVGSANYTVNVNPGVEDIVARAQVFGDLHDAPVNHDAEVIKTIGTAVLTDEPSPEPEPTPGSNLPGLPNTSVTQ